MFVISSRPLGVQILSGGLIKMGKMCVNNVKTMLRRFEVRKLRPLEEYQLYKPVTVRETPGDHFCEGRDSWPSSLCICLSEHEKSVQPRLVLGSTDRSL